MFKDSELSITQKAASSFLTQAHTRYPGASPITEAFAELVNPATAYLKHHTPEGSLTRCIGVNPATPLGNPLARFLENCVIRPTDSEVSARVAGMLQFRLVYWLLKGMVPYAQVDVYKLVRGPKTVDPLDHGFLKRVGSVGYGYQFDPYNLPDLLKHPRSLMVSLGMRSSIDPAYSNDTLAGVFIGNIEDIVKGKADQLIDREGDQILSRRVKLRSAVWIAERRMMTALRKQIEESSTYLKHKAYLMAHGLAKD